MTNTKRLGLLEELNVDCCVVKLFYFCNLIVIDLFNDRVWVKEEMIIMI
jgi:hypothetical protein